MQTARRLFWSPSIGRLQLLPGNKSGVANGLSDVRPDGTRLVVGMESGKNADGVAGPHALTHAIPKTKIADKEFAMRARLFVALVVAVGCIGASSHAQNADTTTIAFTSTRDNPTTVPPIVGGEIYLMDHR